MELKHNKALKFVLRTGPQKTCGPLASMLCEENVKKKLLFLGIAIFLFLFGFLSGSFWTTTRLFRTLPGELSKIAKTFSEKESSDFIRSPASMDSSFWGTIF